jgi:hypothetical protein
MAVMKKVVRGGGKSLTGAPASHVNFPSESRATKELSDELISLHFYTT